SFPSRAWEREATKLCFVTPTPDEGHAWLSGCGRLEAELRGLAFPSRAWERGRTRATRRKSRISAGAGCSNETPAQQATPFPSDWARTPRRGVSKAQLGASHPAIALPGRRGEARGCTQGNTSCGTANSLNGKGASADVPTVRRQVCRDRCDPPGPGRPG